MFKEYLKAISSIYDNYNIKGHTTTVDNTPACREEGQIIARSIKESKYRNVSGISFNKNIGKYHLSHICDEALINAPEFKFNYFFTFM